MNKQPIHHAIGAAAYIVFVVSVMTLARNYMPREDAFLTPIAGLSLFTLSAAVMGYLFLSKPLRLYLDGQKQQAMTFFLQTLGTFAVITVLIWVVMFLGVLS